MSNVSDWKGFEKQVAVALGGKRRDFSNFASHRSRKGGSVVTDIRWPKKMRRKYPIVKKVAVECKKRKSFSLADEMALAKLKYCSDDSKIIVLASKRPNPGSKKKSMKASWKKRAARLIKKAVRDGMSEKEAWKRIKKEMLIGAIVSVPLDFFERLWWTWLKNGDVSEEDKKVSSH